MNQVGVAAKLGVGTIWIRRCQNLMRILNTQSRQLIKQSLLETNADLNQKLHETSPFPKSFRSAGSDSRSDALDGQDWRLTEAVAYRLTSLLTPERTYAESQALVEKALPVILSRQLSGPQVEQLVAWVASGKEAGDFLPAQKVKKQSSKQGPAAPLQGEVSAHQEHKDKTPATQQPEDAGTLAGSQPQVGHPSTQTKNGKLMPLLGGLLGGAFLSFKKNPLSLFMLFGGWLKKALAMSFNRVAQGVLRQAIRWVFSWVLFLFGIGGAFFLFSHGSRTNQIHWPNFGSSPAVPSTSAPSVSTPTHARAFTSKPAKALPAPVANKAPEAGPVVPENQKALVEMDSHFALGFARYFYGASYEATQALNDYFKESVAEDYYDRFMEKYFPAEKMRMLKDKELTMTFRPTQPVRLLRMDGLSEEYLVQGVMTTRSDLNVTGQLVSEKPVAIMIELLHNPRTKGLVYDVKEEGSSNQEQQADSYPKNPSASSGQTDDGVNKVIGDVTGEAAKKLLGF